MTELELVGGSVTGLVSEAPKHMLKASWAFLQKAVYSREDLRKQAGENKGITV
jgi:hypothetical protein